MIKKRKCNLHELKNIHLGKEGYLLGCGPSLLHLEPHRVSNPVIGVNRAGLLPVCDYLVCNHLELQREFINENFNAKTVFQFQGIQTVQGADYLYETFLSVTPKTSVSDLLWHSGCSMTTGFWLMKYMGFSRIHIHGFDCLGAPYYKIASLQSKSYNSKLLFEIRNKILLEANLQGIHATLNSYER